MSLFFFTSFPFCLFICLFLHVPFFTFMSVQYLFSFNGCFRSVFVCFCIHYTKVSLHSFSIILFFILSCISMLRMRIRTAACLMRQSVSLLYVSSHLVSAIVNSFFAAGLTCSVIESKIDRLIGLIDNSINSDMQKGDKTAFRNTSGSRITLHV